MITGTLVDVATRRGVEGRVEVQVQRRYHFVTKGEWVRGAFQFTDIPAGRGRHPRLCRYAERYAPFC